MDTAPKTTAGASDESNTKIGFVVLWVISVIAAGFIGYGIAKGQNPDQKVLQASSQPTQSPQNTIDASNFTAPAKPDTAKNSTVNNTSCSKTGLAQKWEYLTAYEIKANETIQSIATEQLKDESRVNEILQINGVGPLVVGSTLYLPPSTITKSSGNLKQVYGKLMEKNEASWHLGFSSDPKGQGILIPSFLFDNIPEKESYKPGDCLKIFLDDGFTVYSVARQ